MIKDKANQIFEEELEKLFDVVDFDKLRCLGHWRYKVRPVFVKFIEECDKLSEVVTMENKLK